MTPAGTLRREIGHLSGELESLWAMVKLSVCEAKETGVPGVGASAVKLYYTDLYQKITELGLRLPGLLGGVIDDVVLPGLSEQRHAVLAGGLAVLHACFNVLAIEKMQVF